MRIFGLDLGDIERWVSHARRVEDAVDGVQDVVDTANTAAAIVSVPGGLVLDGHALVDNVEELFGAAADVVEFSGDGVIRGRPARDDELRTIWADELYEDF